MQLHYCIGPSSLLCIIKKTLGSGSAPLGSSTNIGVEFFIRRSCLPPKCWISTFATLIRWRLTTGDESDPAQQTIEVRLSRSIAQALHEDVDLINYTQQAASVRLELEIDADFADLSELQDKRQQHGKLRREWRQSGKDSWELDFDYRVEHS